MLPRGDVAAGEADDLAVLGDGLALLDRPQCELVSQTDAAGDGEAFALEVDLHARGQVLGGDGDVIFGTQVDGHPRQRHGGHEHAPVGGGNGNDVPFQHTRPHAAGRVFEPRG